MDGALFVINSIQKDVNLPIDAVVSTVMLLEQDATIPFIARYRKEKTGGLDEVAIRNISDRLAYYRELEERKAVIIKSIETQKKMTDALRKKILDCADKTLLEDIYLPFKIKVKTRAVAAKEKGLEPLADILLSVTSAEKNKEELVAPFIIKDKNVENYKDAVSGARDIIAERVADTAAIRGWVRTYTADTGKIKSTPRQDFKDVKTKYSMYYEIEEPLKTAPSHRLLAIRRGTAEEILLWKILVDDDYIARNITGMILKDRPNLLFRDEVMSAIADSYSRLMAISVQVEAFMAAIKKAEEEAINVFSKNLRCLLLAPPAGSRITIGLDPGYRSGVKVAVVDEKGDFKEFSVIYPTPPDNDFVGSEAVLKDLIDEYEPELVAIGNGTGSKETDMFVRGLIRKHNLKLKSVTVSEAGASVYSASEIAAKEFPDLDVTARGAISIARRLQDPLAELVKIDPKAIGVGQYQHDVNQKELKRSLDLTVESCVNHVGVDVNTASTELLSYVSGIGPAIALNLTKYRKDNGKFKSREELRKVAKLGDKAFEQAAGFLKIRGAANPLDYSGIHPETYGIVEKMAADLGVSSKELPGNNSLIDKIKLQQYVTTDVGIMTLQDIIKELRKPGLDPREEFKSIQFSSTINDLNDLVPGMILTGTITNVANFGVFVDIGVHQDGLIHISKLADSFIKNPYESVEVGDTLKVEVQEVDIDLKRISLKRISGGKLPDAKPTGGVEAGTGGIIGGRKPRREKDDPTKGFSIGSFLEH